MTSIVSKQPLFDLKLDNIALCVVPASNRHEVEVQFAESDSKKDDNLVQITLHFPTGEDEDGQTNAEKFQKDVMNTGVIKSVTGDIIAEFSKEQGNFVTPRGKYAIQVVLHNLIDNLFFLLFFHSYLFIFIK